MSRGRHFLCWFAVLAIAAPSASRAAVSVVVNRTDQPLRVDATLDGKPIAVELAAGDARPLEALRSITVRVTHHQATTEASLEPDCAYAINLDAAQNTPSVQRIPLGEAGPRPWPADVRPPLEFPGAEIIPVKILVDDDEVRQRTSWEPTLRARVAAASDALMAHCGIGLRIVAIETWDSDDNEHDFFRSLGKFEREVLPAPGRVAIGFSSQYDVTPGRFHLGGTRGPLATHILLRERANSVLEPERVEALTHELGHMLGASHSPEPTSVMRPVVGQGLQRRAGARLQFDAPNTLLMSLLGEEIRQRRVTDISAVTPATRRRMAEIYGVMEQSLPEDPAAGQYLQIIAHAGAKPLIADIQRILDHIVRVAKIQAKLRDRAREAMSEPGGGAGLAPLAGDALCELYVRQSAIAAGLKPGDETPRALVVALGFGLDDAEMVARIPDAGELAARFEGATRRRERLEALGAPTLQGDPELMRQFFASALWVALAGSEQARSPEPVRMLLGAAPGERLDFDKIAANRAGIAFAHALLGGRLSLADVGRNFTAAGVLPPIDETARQLGLAAAVKDGVDFAELPTVLMRLEATYSALPIYSSQ